MSNGLSQRQAAKLAGVSQQAISYAINSPAHWLRLPLTEAKMKRLAEEQAVHKRRRDVNKATREFRARLASQR